MVEIANELNIGADSLVFLDDSPAECELMCKMLPEVLTWQGADRKGRPDPLRSLQIIKDTHVFDRLSFTDDDRQRGAMYRRQSARREFERSTTSLEQFLTGLDMRIRIRPADEFTLPRVTELIHRTNQFNLTARRYSAAQIAQFIDDPDSEVFTVRLTDRFGDNGIVGVAIVRSLGHRVLLDTFLLSCRVIGRRVETALLAHLVDWARKENAAQIEGQFKPTPKNAPAADFYARHGFTQVEQSGTESRWCLETKDVSFKWPTYIQLET
jgi:FkbH-like protein